MLTPGEEYFKEIWLVDFEYISPPGDLPQPVCMVAREFITGKEIRLWRDELLLCREPPYSIGEDSLVVAYYASAEFGCHLVLDWPLPVNTLDLFTEFRCITNGRPLPHGKGLLGALEYFGLDSISIDEKEKMRDMILRGAPWTENEQKDILEYCYSDVAALERLLTVFVPLLDVPHALLRGRSMKSVGHIEHNGIPIDTASLETLKTNWLRIQDLLILKIDSEYGVYEGRTFKRKAWEQFLQTNGIPWPTLESGEIDLKDDTFREMAKSYPIVAPVRELRNALSKMKLSDLAVGVDGRNRCMLSPFSSRTGRNQPSNTKYIFGPSSWLRGLIRPSPGRGIAYIDWSQQEFGIAAALSRDKLMMEAYQSGDPYLTFAIQAGGVPTDATKETHSVEREKFKSCVLATQYGMSHKSLSQRIGCTEFEAKELLRLHKQTYKKFWRWSDGVVNHADLNRKLWTTFGWEINYPSDINPRSARNFPMQSNGSEMLRLACCFATERGIKVCAPVHDAILIEFDLENEERDVAAAQEAMREASSLVLGCFELRTDVKIIRYPDRYMDGRGKKMWDTIWEIVESLPKEEE